MAQGLTHRLGWVSWYLKEVGRGGREEEGSRGGGLGCGRVVCGFTPYPILWSSPRHDLSVPFLPAPVPHL